MQTTSIKNVSNEYGEWKNTLSFYKDELQVFKHRLGEVAHQNSSKELMQQVEHFQNQFLVQHENIDILHHDINEHLNTMAGELQDHASHISLEQVNVHTQLKDRVESETKIYNDLKHEFNTFLSAAL